MLRTCFIGCAFLMTIFSEGLYAAEKECPIDPFVGTWEIVSGERDGEAIPAERIKGTKVVITRETIITLDQNEKEVYAATYSLEPARLGCHISMKSTKPPEQEGAASGLILLKGETLKLIYALPDAPMPKEFKTTSGQHLFVMKKIAAQADEGEILKPHPIEQGSKR